MCGCAPSPTVRHACYASAVADMHSYHLPFRSPANRPLCTRNVSRALIERPYSHSHDERHDDTGKELSEKPLLKTKGLYNEFLRSREPQAVGAVYDRPGFLCKAPRMQKFPMMQFAIYLNCTVSTTFSKAR